MYLFLLLLGLLLPAVLILLFSPVKYRVSLSYQEEFDLNINISWIFRLIRAKYTLDGLEVRVAWKKLGQGQEKNLKTATDAGDVKEAASDTVKAAEDSLASHADEEYGKIDAGNQEAPKDNPSGHASPGEDAGNKKKPGFGEKLMSIRKGMIENYERIKYLYHYPHRDEIIKHTLVLLKKEWRAIKPRKYQLEGIIGFDDPAVTGWVLGSLWAVLPILQLKLGGINLQGDFDNAAMRLSCNITGRTSLFSVLWPLLAYARQKPIWVILKNKFFTRKDDKRGNRTGKKH